MDGDSPWIVWIASTLWEDQSTDRCLASALSRWANVLWVDRQFSPASTAGRRRGAARRIMPDLRELNGRMLRLTPVAPPGMTRAGARAATAAALHAQLRWALRRAGVQPLTVVTTRLDGIGTRRKDGVRTVLHGTDDYVAGAGLFGVSARWLATQERRAVTQADQVTACSEVLARRWAALRSAPVACVPNGCDWPAGAPARPAELGALRRPVVALAGQLNARIDLGLLEAITDAGYSLLLVGPHDPRWQSQRFAALCARPQVRYCGRVRPEEMGRYLAAADIGITPYLDTPFNRASFPIKSLDYLSAGLPVVSTDLPAARWLRRDLEHSGQAEVADQMLTVAGNRPRFVAGLRRMAGPPGRAGARRGTASDACRAFATRHVWSRRAEQLAALIGLT